jgi:hypothetical protein
MTTMTDTTSQRIAVLPHSTEATGPEPGQIRIPIVMPASQTYYWSAAWQRAEAESLADYSTGAFIQADDPEDVIRWLDESEDEE